MGFGKFISVTTSRVAPTFYKVWYQVSWAIQV